MIIANESGLERAGGREKYPNAITERPQRWKVLLDSVPIENVCFLADDEAGEAHCYVLGRPIEEGKIPHYKLAVQEGKRRPVIEVKRGRVEIIEQSP